MLKKERGERRATLQGDETRQHILATALGLFRERGFDATTMRDVARAADLSLGAAYYYFPSKEAIVTGYYDALIDEHRTRVLAAIAIKPEDKAPGAIDLRARLAAVLHTKIDLVLGDRAIFGALFRFVGHPDHPLSPLGPATRSLRERSMVTIEDALGDAPVAPELRALTVRSIWALEMGVLLYFLYDTSPGSARTRRLIEGALDATCGAISLSALPMSGPLLAPVLHLLREAGLLAGEGGD